MKSLELILVNKKEPVNLVRLSKEKKKLSEERYNKIKSLIESRRKEEKCTCNLIVSKSITDCIISNGGCFIQVYGSMEGNGELEFALDLLLNILMKSDNQIVWLWKFPSQRFAQILEDKKLWNDIDLDRLVVIEQTKINYNIIISNLFRDIGKTPTYLFGWDTLREEFVFNLKQTCITNDVVKIIWFSRVSNWSGKLGKDIISMMHVTSTLIYIETSEEIGSYVMKLSKNIAIINLQLNFQCV